MKNYKILCKVGSLLNVGEISEIGINEMFTKIAIVRLIADEYIEEIQEPEFTQREMKDRCVNFLQNHSGHSLNRSIEIYNNWIKGK